ncbi:MAG TPA: YhjD/YihY/BrkB family envelope integrity protein [Ktedonobacteraceae bacterium]
MEAQEASHNTDLSSSTPLPQTSTSTPDLPVGEEHARQFHSDTETTGPADTPLPADSPTMSTEAGQVAPLPTGTGDTKHALVESEEHATIKITLPPESGTASSAPTPPLAALTKSEASGAEQTASPLAKSEDTGHILVESEEHASIKITLPADSDTTNSGTNSSANTLLAAGPLAKLAGLEETELEKATFVIKEVTEDARHVLIEAEKHTTVKIAVEDVTSFGEFSLKFLNDWTFNFASGLAYHLLMAMFPIVIAVAATVGFIEGGLSSHAQNELINYMSNIFPSVLGHDVLAPALLLLRKDAGFLGITAIVLALYSGSRLFSTMEDCFAIIYHTPSRPFWRQNMMAMAMLLIFILLIPVMLLASSIGLGGFLSGLLASIILFQAVYMIVPNQKISWRKSWRGTLVASIALQVYIVLFPLYIRHFLGSYTGNTGFAIILLLFFFYFALILLIGAEVNAFYAEGVRAKPHNIAEMVHLATLAADTAELAELANKQARKRAIKH